MIRRIEALRYRSLRYIRQEIAPCQFLVGPNASGKSNFLDVVAFLGDLVNHGPLVAARGEPKRGVPSRSQDPRHLCWLREGSRFELAVELAIADRLRDQVDRRFARARYEVAVETAMNGDEVGLAGETLWLTPEEEERKDRQLSLFPVPPSPPETLLTGRTPTGWKKVVNKVSESGTDYFMAETSGWNNPFKLGPAKSTLANLPEDETKFPVAVWVKKLLSEGIHRVALNAEAMRRPNPPGTPKAYAPDGSNLAWVVESLRKAPERFQRWLRHVRTALPDVSDIQTIERPEDRHRYLVVRHDSGFEAPSWLVSDGTLRLLALTLLAYLPDLEGTYLIEEPENGIHPRAMETVYESLSSIYGSQILCASHSPVLLRLTEPKELLCFGKSKEGATDVVRGHEHPRLKDWRGRVDLGMLHAAGVLG